MKIIKTIAVTIFLLIYLFINHLFAQTLNNGITPKSLIVLKVIENSSAEKAGIKTYDIIYSLNNKVFYEINSPKLPQDFMSFINTLPIGNYELIVLRNGEKVKLTVKLPEKTQSGRLGIYVETIENDPQIYFDRAIQKLNVAEKREDLKEVAKYFEIAKALSPQWEDAYYNLGLIYDKLDYYDKVYENYSKYFDFLKNRNAPLEEQTKTADLLVKASVNNRKLNEIKEKMVNGIWLYPSLAPGLKPCTVSSFGRFCGDKIDLSNASFILDKEIPQQRFYIIRSKVYNFGPTSYFYPKFNIQSNGKVWNRNIIEYEYGDLLKKEEAMQEGYLTILALKESLKKFPWFEVVWDGRFFEIRHVFISLLPSSNFPYYLINFYLFKGEIRIDTKPNFIIIREYSKSDKAPGDENFDKVLDYSFNKLKNLNIDNFKFSKELRFIYRGN